MGQRKTAHDSGNKGSCVELLERLATTAQSLPRHQTIFFHGRGNPSGITPADALLGTIGVNEGLTILGQPRRKALEEGGRVPVQRPGLVSDQGSVWTS